MSSRCICSRSEGWTRSAIQEYDTERQALSRFSLAAVLMSEPILRLVRRQLRQMSPDARVELDQIKTVLLKEVLKRDVIEGEKAEDARKRVTRVNKARRVKVAEAGTPPESANAAAAGATE
jgi:hypothetical protein